MVDGAPWDAGSSGSLPPPVPGVGIDLHDDRLGRVQLYAIGPSTTTERSPSPVLLIHSVNAAASAYEVRPLYEHLGARRPTYALDLPGFGLSERSDRRYSPRLMTDAVLAAVDHVRQRHDGARLDALAVSLGCEFLARAAIEDDEAFRSLAFVSPTGLGRKRRDGPAGATLGSSIAHAIVSFRLWSGALFGLLTRPRVVRYFLARTFGRDEIDEGLWAYAVRTAREPGAKHAPLWFLSGHLFSADATLLYEGLDRPAWICHGVRGDFVDYEGVQALLAHPSWSRTVLETGALPYFEDLDAFLSAYADFLERVPVE